MNRFRIATIALLVLVGAPGSGLAQDSAPEPEASPFVAYMDYLVRDGGHWRTENPDFDPEANPFRTFVYRIAWAFRQRIATVTISGVRDDCSEAVFWEITTAWHPAEERVAIFQVGWAGDLLTGEDVAIDDRTRQVTLSGWNAAGEPYRFRDVSTILEDDVFESVTYVPDVNGEWRAVQTLRWERVGDADR